jgi:hypothetical protein
MSAVSLGAGAAHAQQEPIQRIFSPDSFAVTVEGDRYEGGIRTYSDIQIRSETSVYTIDNMSFTPMLGGDISMHIDTMRISPFDSGVASSYISGLTFQFSEWPGGEDNICAWADVISKAEVDRIGISYQDVNSPLLAVHLEDLSLEAQSHQNSCWFDGLAAFGGVKVHLHNGASFDVSGIRTNMNLPLSRQAATNAQTAYIKAGVDRIEAWEKGSSSVFGFSDIGLSANFASSSLQGALILARSASFLSPDGDMKLDLMQAFNAASLLDGTIKLTSPQMRIYSAGVLPAEAVANFSRAGMSTITGSISADLDMSNGISNLTAETTMSGLVDVAIDLQSRSEPYSRNLLKLAKAGKISGAHLIPKIYPEMLSIRYQDIGLDAAIQDVAGVPFGRVIQEYGQIYSSQQPKALVAPYLRMTGWLSGYFRRVATGNTTTLTVQPQEDRNLADVFYQVLTSQGDSVDGLTVKYRENSP